jgi:peptidoglycan/LPS O-acetylase OafA/YrhL
LSRGIAGPFRHDINGLRAIAVLVVVLFHFRVPGFEAGYLGVDVFFVISGYLMAALLMRGLDDHRLTVRAGGQVLGAFYLARAQRIVPALLALVAVLLVFGWWALSPGDYEQLARHARHTVGFISNHQFYEEAGYFDVASHEKWLLHTWSLSVEWQFYLLFPLLVLGGWYLASRRRGLVTAMVGVLTLVSLAISVWTTQRNPEAAFYLLPSRAWELLTGSLVYLMGNRFEARPAARRWLEGTGIGLIVVSLVVFGGTTPWPGAAAVVPVVGTALVLLAARHAAGWALPWGVQWLGRTSYSLYLWHWPVFVALVYLDVQGNPWAIGFALALSIALGTLSFILVEQPSRRRLTHWGAKPAAAALVTAAFCTVSVAVAIQLRDGIFGRMPDQIDRIMAEAHNINPHREECHGRPGWNEFPWCNLGGENIRAVVIGDSHAASMATAVLEAVASSPEDGIIMATYTACQTLFGARKPREHLECAEFNRFIQAQLEGVPDDVPVVVINRLSGAAFGPHLRHDRRYGTPSVYFGDEPVSEPTDAFLDRFRQDIRETACTLAQDRPVYWMRPTPEMPVNVPRWLARQTMLQGDSVEVTLSLDAYTERHAFVTRALNEAERSCDNVHVLDPQPWLCNGDECRGSYDGMPLYYDEHHLSERGNRKLVPMFEQIIVGNGPGPMSAENSEP